MEDLFSVQALVHYYDKASVDHAAVKRLLSSANIDHLQLLLSDGSTTTLQNYVLIPRPERPSVTDVIAYGGQSPVALAAVVMLAEARAAADSVASSSLELDIACSALERLLGSLIPTFKTHPSDNMVSCVDKCAVTDSIYRRTLAGRRHLNVFGKDSGSFQSTGSTYESPSSILTSVNTRLRLCDIATHCLAVVARQCVQSESKCREAMSLSTRLLSLAHALPPDAASSPSASFSSRNSLRTALISGAIHAGVIASENFEVDVSAWVRNANQLMLNHYADSGRSQIIAAVFGGMLPVCTEYSNVATDKSAISVTIPLSILHEVLGEELERSSNQGDTEESLEQSMSDSSTGSSVERISKAAQSFLGERVVAAEEDGDEGRIAGGSGYNACENYIKRASEGSGIKDLLVSILLAACTHCSTYQSRLPASPSGPGDEADTMSDGCTSNSEGHPGSIDLFDQRSLFRGFSVRPSSSVAADSDLDVSRSLTYHRKVAVLCIEALGSWLLLTCQTFGDIELSLLLQLLETISLNASTLLVSRNIANFDVRAALANFGNVCGAIFNSGGSASDFWRSHVCDIVRKSRHCVVLLKQMLWYCDSVERVRGVLSCYVSEFLLNSTTDAEEESRRKSSEDYLLYMMSLISAENALEVLVAFSEQVVLPIGLPPDSSKLVLFHYAVTLHILDFFVKLAFGLAPSKSKVQITIVRLCNRANETNDSLASEEITSQDELLADDFAKVNPSKEVVGLFSSVLSAVEKVLHDITGIVLDPFWGVTICPSHERSSTKLSYLRGLPNSDIMEAGESVLDAASSLHQTLMYACRASSIESDADAVIAQTTNNHVKSFFDCFSHEDGVLDALDVVLEELQSCSCNDGAISLSSLYRIECCSAAIEHSQSTVLWSRFNSSGTLVKLLDMCLKRFANIVPIGFSNLTSGVSAMNAGLFGKKSFDELSSRTSSSKVLDVNEVEHYSPVRENIRLACRYSELLRCSRIDGLVRSVLDKLSVLVTRDVSFISEGQSSIVVLADIVSLCWPVYINIASPIYGLLHEFFSTEIKDRDLESNFEAVEVTNVFLRMSNWRYFIQEAPNCPKVLHSFCHFAERSISNSDFDLESLALALLGTGSNTLLPGFISECVRSNTIDRIFPELLICGETAGVAVQSHARALNSLSSACKASSVWRNGVVSGLHEHVLSTGSSGCNRRFFNNVVKSSVMESSTMSSAISELVAVLGEAKTEAAAHVLEMFFEVAAEVLETNLLTSPNAGLYRIIEFIIRLCAAFEESRMDLAPYRSLLADLVNLLTSCITQLNESFGSRGLTDKNQKLAIVFMGLLHLCRQGHVSVEPEPPCSETSCLSKDCPSVVRRQEEKSPPQRSSKRVKQMDLSSRAMEPKLKSKSKQKTKWSKKTAKDVDLCTFTTTGDQFVEQHWYFCYTCGLTGSEGVCAVCARRCHSECDIAYSRHSRFFCDCGASGSDPKALVPIPPPPSHPAGSSDSDVSLDRKDSARKEKRVPPKRRRCISLRPQDFEGSSTPASSQSNDSPSSSLPERTVFPNKSFLEKNELEVNLLSFASPIIGRCLELYENEESKSDRTETFQKAISCSKTVGSVLDLAYRLMDSRMFFHDSMDDDYLVDFAAEKWYPMDTPTRFEMPQAKVMSILTSDDPLGKLTRVLKGGGFKSSKNGFAPVALSSLGENLVVGQENGSVLVFKASAALTCKSSLEKSSLLRMGELSVPFPVRGLSFHPTSEDTLLVVGDAAICVVIMTTEPLTQLASIQLELGLNLFGGDLGFSTDSCESSNRVHYAEWVPSRDCAVLVRTETFVKVFDVNKDNVSPCFFVPTRFEGTEMTEEAVQKESYTSEIVECFPLSLTDGRSTGVELIAFTENGDLLVSSSRDGDTNLFPVSNVLTPRGRTSVLAVSRGERSDLFWVACKNGSILSLLVKARDTGGKKELRVDNIVEYERAFEPADGNGLLSLLYVYGSLLVYYRGGSLSSSSILTLDQDNVELMKHSFPEGHSGSVASAVWFSPSPVEGCPSRPGCFILLEDGGFFRLDLSVGAEYLQFPHDPESTELTALLSDIQTERCLNKHTVRKRKVLVHDKYNPVPSIIGFFEKARLVQETARLTYSSGSEPETEMKVALGGNSSEFVISSVPFMPFHVSVSVDLHGSNSVLVGARIKLGASDRSKQRVPRVVRVFGREVRWTSRNGLKRWLDIPFTVLESSRSPRQVSFEFEPHKPQSGDSSAVDGLVAIDNIQIHEVSQTEFSDRKALFDNEALMFNTANESTKSKRKSEFTSDELSESRPRSAVRLFKSFDSRYAVALCAVDIACKSSQLPLESTAKLALSIGAHSLKLVHHSNEEPLRLLDESRRLLLHETFQSWFETESKEEVLRRTLTIVSNVCRRGLVRFIFTPVFHGYELFPAHVEMSVYCLRVVSSLCISMYSDMEESQETFKSLSRSVLTSRISSEMFEAHSGLGLSGHRLFVSPRKATENLTDLQLALLVWSLCVDIDSGLSNDAIRSLIALVCHPSRAVRLFASRRLAYVLREPSRLISAPGDVLQSHDLPKKYSFSFDMNVAEVPPENSEVCPSADSSQRWAYRCDNCEAVCKKEWWHCMDCEDFDLCDKCVRGDRSSFSPPHSDSHILVRGDPEHNLDELNSDTSEKPLSTFEQNLIDVGFSSILSQLAEIEIEGKDGRPRPLFTDAALMLSSIISPQTPYQLRVKYITRLCSSSDFVSRIMRGIGSIVPLFDMLKSSSSCKLNSNLGPDWDFAFVFLQVFSSVRDSVSLPPLFRSGIPSSFAYILKQIEPTFSDVLRHAISYAESGEADSESKLEMFDSVWRKISVSSLHEDDSSNQELADVSSSFTEIGTLSPVVSALLQLILHIIDFLGFALQNASGPGIDEVISSVPKSLLCSIIASESSDPRIKGITAIHNMITVSRRLLLVVSGKDEASMHRVIDSHIYRTHILDLRSFLSTLSASKSAVNYAVQVDVANSFKSLHRLVSKRPSTWRDFCINEPDSLDVILETIAVSDYRSHGLAVQLLAVACSVSNEMAVDSIRTASTSSRTRKSDAPTLKMKKSIDDTREVADTQELGGSSEAQCVIRSFARAEWVASCSQMCKDVEQISLDLFSRNQFSVLNRIILTLLMQRQNPVIRIAIARILCCIIARAAFMDDDQFCIGLYETFSTGISNLAAAGGLGAEFSYCLEVFVVFCNEGHFECLGKDRVSRIVSFMIDSLRSSAAALVSHPNAHIYKSLANVVDLQGYYLEADPCTTCSTEAFESSVPVVQRLEGIRVEAKYTDCQIMCRLSSVQAVSGVLVKVVDPRKTRRVKKIDVSYSPRIVSDSTELKSANHPWHHFATINLSPTQVEGKVDLSVPISTANLRYHFSEFYSPTESSTGIVNDSRNATRADDSAGGSGMVENLQCPRCSRSVTDRYGICRNCHENAFQCRQCRNINYENLDGFLCNECGYCKHARFEFSVTCKSSFVAEKILSEDDRKRASMVIEKEIVEVHRKHEELKKMRSKVLKSLALGPRYTSDMEILKEETHPKPNEINDAPIRADIATLEALLGGHLPHEVGEGMPIAVEGGPAEILLGGAPASLDLSGRGIRDPRRSSVHPFSFLAKQAANNARDVSSTLASAPLSRQTSLIAVLYARDCKSLFLSMSQSIGVLSATRQELIQYASSCLKRDCSLGDSVARRWKADSGDGSRFSNILSPVCYGCTQSFLANCVDFLHGIISTGGVAMVDVKTSELCVEMLKLSSLCENKQVQTKVRKLIAHVVSENEEASDAICHEISKKIEFCIDSYASVDARSVGRLELALLEDIALVEDSNWEKRFRTVMRILFRASKTALSCASISETVILPCLRTALHLLRVDEAVDSFQEPADFSPHVDPDTPGADLPEESSRSALMDIESVASGEVNVASPVENIPSLIDGAESVASSELRQYRLESDQLSISGAPSSIGTAFEEHPSDDESQTKIGTRSAADVNSIVEALKEDHESGVHGLRVEHWLDECHTHEEWLAYMSNRGKIEPSRTGEEDPEMQTKRWLFQRWRSYAASKGEPSSSESWSGSWAVRLLLLAPSTQVRESASLLIQALISNEEVLHLKLLDSLSGDSLLKAVSVAERSREFFGLLSKLVRAKRSKLYLIAKGFATRLAKMILDEAEKLFNIERSANGIHSFSLSYGFVLNELVRILKTLLDEISKMKDSVRVKIFEVEDGCVVHSLQQAYLLIRRLLSLRTRLTEESGKILCDILSSSDYLFFAGSAVKVVRACVSELKSAHARGDVSTVSVLLEQLCGMLCPETAEPVCYLTLNKSPTQDEYIRGSMTKNPYSSTSFSGPLMRDVKNKICEDLDLPALLEDDFGMELLVAGNLVKLDLPIMAVYEQVWRNSPHATMASASPGIHRTYGSRGSSVSGMSTGSIHPLDMMQAPRRREVNTRHARNGEDRVDPPMTVIYRLAGLDGEATENIIDSLVTDSDEDLDLEALYKSTEMLGDVNGLDVLLSLLSIVGSWGDDAETAIREPALKLLRACCEVSKNRSILAAKPGTLSTLLECAASAFEHSQNSPVAVESAESLLIASEKILAEKSIGGEVLEQDVSMRENLDEVLSRMQVFLGRLSVVSSSKAEASILHLLPFLMQGIPAAVEATLEHFQFVWDVVERHDPHVKIANQFATVLVAAPRDYRGQAIILRALEEDCAPKAVAYLCKKYPMPKSENKETWEESLDLNGPPAALKLLKGLAYGCSSGLPRRTEACDFIEAAMNHNESTIRMLCQLEITASSSYVGSVAEELLDALLENERIVVNVEHERLKMKEDRRKAAEASRQAILQEAGLSQGPTGTDAAGSYNHWLDADMFDDVVDEVGPACVVCGDGFRSRPNEALGIYVLSRRVQMDCSIPVMLSAFTTPANTLPSLGRVGSRRESEPHLLGRSRGGSTSGSSSFCYTTVTQFNAIHLSCHRDAARTDRGSRREEWEGATLRNSQTICNNILPILPPLTCTIASPTSTDAFNAASSSMNVATEYYLARLMALGRSSLPAVKLSLYDLGRALVRFCDGGTQVFSEHSKGGGPHSNACLLPHMVQLTLHLLNTTTSSPVSSATDPTQVSEKVVEMGKYLKGDESGDFAYHLAVALVFLSIQEWRTKLPAFLRLAIRECECSEIAFRLIGFTDVVIIHLKNNLASSTNFDALREHIGKDETFSETFADSVVAVWEQDLKAMKTKDEFLKLIKCLDGLTSTMAPDVKQELDGVLRMDVRVTEWLKTID